MAVTEQQYDPSEDEDATDGEDGEVAENIGLSYTLEQIKRDTTARIGMYIIGFMTAVAIFTTIDAVVFDYGFAKTFLHDPVSDPDDINGLRLLPPAGMGGELKYPLGTDARGRDILTRLIYGTRIAMTAGFFATVIGTVGGTIIGAVSGYYGGWIDDVLQRLTETIYSIPFLVLVIAIMAALGDNIWFAIVGVGIISIPTFNRLIRSRVVSIREEEYIEAAKAAGVKDRNIILRHVIPNSFTPVLVQSTLQIGFAILTIAGLSFLGFGAQPPTPSWGQMLSGSRNHMINAPTYSIWPGLAILITVLGFNLFGDGLQDALDPRIDN
ncbi:MULTISPECIES: ABC transporter permease [unclassified Natrinema]|uniref:ABC transporter permease n=1 Tax=unclassified Natrinema TaxID=2622230 RepID=UPI00026D490C|nr:MULTISPECIES: ABC transporter permease [unclassified Natrinema]AFO55652.1 ABC-type transport system permease [Natrinema sp. J7-2]